MFFIINCMFFVKEIHFDRYNNRFFKIFTPLLPSFKKGWRFSVFFFLSLCFFSSCEQRNTISYLLEAFFRQQKAMPIATSPLSMNCGAVDLIQVTTFLHLSRGPFNDIWLDNGAARWISCQSEGLVISACYHRTKWHSATVQTGIGPFFHEVKSRAPPGQWAVAWQNANGRDMVFYDY